MSRKSVHQVFQWTHILSENFTELDIPSTRNSIGNKIYNTWTFFLGQRSVPPSGCSEGLDHQQVPHPGLYHPGHPSHSIRIVSQGPRPHLRPVGQLSRQDGRRCRVGHEAERRSRHSGQQQDGTSFWRRTLRDRHVGCETRFLSILITLIV